MELEFKYSPIILFMVFHSYSSILFNQIHPMNKLIEKIFK